MRREAANKVVPGIDEALVAAVSGALRRMQAQSRWVTGEHRLECTHNLESASTQEGFSRMGTV